MTQFSTNILKFHGPHEGAFVKFIADRRKWLQEALMRRKSYNQTVYELSICSDRDLADMGISRWDIRRLARESAQRKTIE